jgi:hypothetical protein
LDDAKFLPFLSEAALGGSPVLYASSADLGHGAEGDDVEDNMIAPSEYITTLGHGLFIRIAVWIVTRDE